VGKGGAGFLEAQAGPCRQARTSGQEAGPVDDLLN
jgi:hypothetical protein